MRTTSTRVDHAVPRSLQSDTPSEGALSASVNFVDRFLFTPADPTTLGVIRFCTGIVVLYLHLVYTGSLQDFFGRNAWLDLATADAYRKDAPTYAPTSAWTDESQQIRFRDQDDESQKFFQKWGVWPQKAINRGYYYWSIWYHVTDPTWMMVWHVGILVVMVLFTLGIATRVTSALTWAAAMCYIQRDFTILYGVDTMMNLALFYLMLGPSGAAFSVDRLLARWWTARQSGARLGSLLERTSPPPLISANLIQRLMQVHFCIIYLSAGTSKLQGPAWWSGTALWGCMANYEFAPMHLAIYNNFIIWLSKHRTMWELTLSGQAVFTLFLELGFPFLVWVRRLRPWMIGGAVLLHTGIAVIMGLGTFSLFMLCLVLAFVPGEALRRGLRVAVDWLRGEEDAGRPHTTASGELVLQGR
jgi:hypothetical protein